MLELIIILIALLIATPPSLFFHELGHCLAAKGIKASSIEISIGVGTLLWKIKLLGIDISIHSFFMVNYYAKYHRPRPFSSFEKVFISLMGPCFSLLLACLFFIIYIITMAPSMYVIFLFNLWIGILNIIPFKIGQKKSDGYTICKQVTRTVKKGR